MNNKLNNEPSAYVVSWVLWFIGFITGACSLCLVIVLAEYFLFEKSPEPIPAHYEILEERDKLFFRFIGDVKNKPNSVLLFVDAWRTYREKHPEVTLENMMCVLDREKPVVHVEAEIKK